MWIKGISRRWLFNFSGIVVLIVIVLIISLSYAVKNYTYNGIFQALNANSRELTNVFIDYKNKTSSDFITVARTYVENFSSKESMELMVLDSDGQVVLTSTGFTPDMNQSMPDYQSALQDAMGYGSWRGKLSSGEKVMAVTRVLRDNNGMIVGGVRYVVSLENADHQVLTFTAILIGVGILIILFVNVSGIYFIKSILNPVREINKTAQRIAQGDFDARIQKKHNDEIGELCDTVNEMAVELGNAEQMKNDFISSVSHELRTPLTAIKGWAESMQSGEIDRSTFDKGMGVIIRESERLSGIVEELLDFSRMQSGRMTLMMDRIDILAELGEAVYMFSDRARAEHKYLLYEEPAMLSPVLGDINRLRQVFVNIIDNALKYTEEQGTVSISAYEEAGYIKVQIVDTGCGIPTEHLPNVKKKFYKANQTVRGSGIGLALADEIIMLHRGTLDVESQENTGTAVTIKIPVMEQINGKEIGWQGQTEGGEMFTEEQSYVMQSTAVYDEIPYTHQEKLTTGQNQKDDNFGERKEDLGNGKGANKN